MAKIVVVDDHQLFQAGMKSILEAHGHKVSADFSDPEQFMTELPSLEFDVLIIDLTFQSSLSGHEVIDFTVDYYAQQNKDIPPILVLSHKGYEYFAKKCIIQGAKSYLNKSCTSDELLEAIKSLASGQVYYPKIVEELINGDKKDFSKRPVIERLSERELSVFLGIAKGHSFKDIAEELNVSIKTVSTYRTRISQKTGLNSFNDMILYAHQNFLVEKSDLKQDDHLER